MSNKSNFRYHLLAWLTILVWGTSFPCTKILLTAGVTPTEIYVYRTAVAYAALLLVSRFSVKLWGWRDELIAVLCGLTGGTIYFVAQNFALDLTLLSDVVIVVAINPLVTTILAAVFLKEERFSWKILAGSAIAFAGVAVVTLRDGFVWGNGLAGNLLAILAAVAWSVYSVLLKRVQERHSTLEVTRKMMFYGTALALPLLPIQGFTPPAVLLRPDVALNLLYLALLCSMGAFFAWNVAIKRIGTISASNYLYLEPIVTLVMGAIMIGERVGVVAVVGCALVMLGVVMVERK